MFFFLFFTTEFQGYENKVVLIDNGEGALLDFLRVIGEIVEEMSKSSRNGEKRHE